MAFSDYHVGYMIVTDRDVLVRVAAAVQQEKGSLDGFEPEEWARTHAWDYGTQSDWIDAVSYAMETGNQQWGADPGVITDQHILSYVQSALA